MKAWKIAAPVAIAAVVAASARAGTIRHDAIDDVYVNFGLVFSNVGQVAFSNTSGDYLGSGTLISPYWVLTAAHAVEDATDWSFLLGGITYPANPPNLVPHPSWDGNTLNGHDIGLARLNVPVDSAATGISPAVRYTGSSELGQVGTAVGYGKTGTGLTGAVTFDGKKRAGQNVLDEFYEIPGETHQILLSDFDSGSWLDNTLSGDSQPKDMEFLMAPGDSGGGLFIPVSGWRLAGVHSFVMGLDGDPNSDYGDVSGHTRVSVFNAWIDDVTAPPIPGDANLSGVVDGEDFTLLKANYGAVGDPGDLSTWPIWEQGNFNGDRLVDGQDFSILKAHYGEGSAPPGGAAPEPEALGLLAAGGLVTILRGPRRKASPRAAIDRH